MAGFARGQQSAEARNARSGGKFTPTMKFEAGKSRYVQFLLPMDDVFNVSMHRFIIVGKDEAGNEQYAHFISRTDPNLDGADGYDELISRFGLTPVQRTITLAAELEPVYGSGSGARKKIEGFELATRQYEDRDGVVQEVPAFQLVEMSWNNFFSHLAANNDMKPIEETIFAVKRTGKSTDTNYTFIDTGFDALDLEEEYEEFAETFDLEAYLEDLASEDRMRELIGPLPDDWKVSMFADRGKGKRRDDKEEERPRSRSRRSFREEPEEDGEPSENGSEPEEGEEEGAETPSRARRFKRLQGQTQKR